jgi:hypothetical protein
MGVRPRRRDEVAVAHLLPDPRPRQALRVQERDAAVAEVVRRERGHAGGPTGSRSVITLSPSAPRTTSLRARREWQWPARILERMLAEDSSYEGPRATGRARVLARGVLGCDHSFVNSRALPTPASAARSNRRTHPWHSPPRPSSTSSASRRRSSSSCSSSTTRGGSGVRLSGGTRGTAASSDVGFEEAHAVLVCLVGLAGRQPKGAAEALAALVHRRLLIFRSEYASLICDKESPPAARRTHDCGHLSLRELRR